ncbi:MAG TPA: cytochrome c-type biogenesis protein [SAR202 cluster bacterium]|nr:cytochrome c-type biogenesis protein CcmH [SAR202 cluster bacterium]HJO80985.1 cytochrome c-type biogenesis protein [SAR202 cluster bacterium]
MPGHIGKYETVRTLGWAGFKPARHVRLPIWITITSSVLFLAIACSGGVDGEVPEIESRALQLNKTIMCPVCPGESIDQSQNALAVQMRGIVADKLAEGWTEKQVQDFFVERYGPSVLLEPPRSGVDLMAWIIPPVGIVIAGAMLFLVLKWMTKPDAEFDDAAEGSLSDDERSQYFERIEAVLDNEVPRRDEASPG